MDGGQRWCEVKMLKILFWAFSNLFEIVVLEHFRLGFLLKMTRIQKVLITFGDFWVGISKNERNSFSLFQGGGRVHGCLVVW